MRTRVVPSSVKSRSSAARLERSMIRLVSAGPRSLILTSTERRFVRLVTRTTAPIGKVRWAAVKAPGSNGSPLAVRRPRWALPYQEATPTCVNELADGGGALGVGGAGRGGAAQAASTH